MLVLGGWLIFGAAPMIRILWPHLRSSATFAGGEVVERRSDHDRFR